MSGCVTINAFNELVAHFIAPIIKKSGSGKLAGSTLVEAKCRFVLVVSLNSALSSDLVATISNSNTGNIMICEDIARRVAESLIILAVSANNLWRIIHGYQIQYEMWDAKNLRRSPPFPQKRKLKGGMGGVFSLFSELFSKPRTPLSACLLSWLCSYCKETYE